MSFGSKLLELRKQRGLSQEDLALDLNTSQSSISNYESGLTKPDISFLEKTSQYFSVPIQELLSEENLVSYNQQNTGGQNGCYYVVNTFPDKLIEQYEKRIQEKDELIKILKEQIDYFRS